MSTAAFFDFDGTLIDGYSAMAFLSSRARGGEMPPGELLRLLQAGLGVRAGKADFDDFMRVGVQAFRGHDERTLARLGEQLLKETLGGQLFPEMLELIAWHRAQGHELVIASSALPFQVEPLARELGFDHVLCTRLEAIHDVYTGRVHGPVLWGPGKARAVEQFAAEHGVELAASYGYGNGDEDIEFLSATGNPRPVNPKPELAAVADREDWPVLRCAARGRPGVTAVARTVAAYGGMAGAFGTGIALSVLRRNRREGVDFTLAHGSDLALGLAGISLNVTGGENIERARPAVVIFNHTSILDGLIVLKLLRHDITGAGKKELSDQPGIGQLMKWANIAMLDRSNTAQAIAALEPVVQRLRDGYSIVIAPEGTRMPTPTLGRFKKGPFHMAMQGDVPILPIVIRNAGEHLWRGSKVMRPGVIDVHVLEPVSVEGWTPETMEEEIAGVRRQFVETLADWPRRASLNGPAVVGTVTASR
jgi:putative phosphoserine phosphatase/1-acylglycerol-3-phosphate O-acyltransferase